jgi:hypothetical protein
MQSDFQLACKAARNAIVVPEVPLRAMRDGAYQRHAGRGGRRRRGVFAAVVATCSIVAAAAAAELFGHVQISLQPSGAMQVYFDGNGGRWAPVRNPTERDIQNAARQMNFAVVLPQGLPRGTDAEGLTVLGPGAMEIVYNLPGAWRRSNHLLFVILANPKSIVPEGAKPPVSKYSLGFGVRTRVVAHWIAGQEEVIVRSNTLTPAELARLKAAMTAQAR